MSVCMYVFTLLCIKNYSFNYLFIFILLIIDMSLNYKRRVSQFILMSPQQLIMYEAVSS